MDYTKQPLDYPRILQMLKDRGLIIRNDNDAVEQLKIMSYFRLANYLRPMLWAANSSTLRDDIYKQREKNISLPLACLSFMMIIQTPRRSD